MQRWNIYFLAAGILKLVANGRNAPVVLCRLSAGPGRQSVCMSAWWDGYMTCSVFYGTQCRSSLTAPFSSSKTKICFWSAAQTTCIVHCSCINGKGKELDVKHLVHITAFKEDIYTIQKYNTLLCVRVAEWKDLLFSGGSSLSHACISCEGEKSNSNGSHRQDVRLNP